MATKKTASSKRPAAKAKTTKVSTVRAVSASSSRRRLSALRGNGSSQVGAAVAEFVGTFILAAAIIAGQGQPVLVLFAIVGVVLAVGAASGAHINPALTIAAWVTRKVSSVRAVVYIVAQVLGAMMALVVLNAFSSQAPEVSSQAAMLGQGAQDLFKATAIPNGKEWAVLLAELLGAAIFGFAFATARKQVERLTKAFTVGLGLFLALLIAGSAAAAVSGMAIVNPAVAVALQAIDFASVWPVAVYVFATSVGAVVGFLLSDLLSSEAYGTTDVE